MGGIAFIVPMLEGFLVLDPFGHDAEPAIGLQAGPQLIQDQQGLGQVFDYFSRGDEVPALAQRLRVGVVVQVVQANLMAVLTQHGRQGGARATAKIQPVTAGP